MRGKPLLLPALPVLVPAPWMLANAGAHDAAPAPGASPACARDLPGSQVHDEVLTMDYDRTFPLPIAGHGCVAATIDVTKALPVSLRGDLATDDGVVATCTFLHSPLSSCSMGGDGSGTAALRVHGSGAGPMRVVFGTSPGS